MKDQEEGKKIGEITNQTIIQREESTMAIRIRKRSMSNKSKKNKNLKSQ